MLPTTVWARLDRTRCILGNYSYSREWQKPDAHRAALASLPTFPPAVRTSGAGHRHHPFRRIRMTQSGSSKTQGSRNVSSTAATDDNSRHLATCFDTNAKSRVPQASHTATVAGLSSPGRPHAMGIWHTTSASHGHSSEEGTCLIVIMNPDHLAA